MSAFPPKQPPLEKIALAPLPEQPLVSIIVPSFNQGRYIRETIDSILEQDYRPLQIHVIDGNSYDETVSVLESYGDIPELDWISEPDSGVVDAVNKGFAKVKGDIVAIQSSDDRYLPGAVHAIIKEFLSANSEIPGLIYGDTVKIDDTGVELQRYRIAPWSLESLFLRKTWIPQPSCFFRRELLQTCGGWDESIPYAPDTDLWIRMAFRTEVRKVDVYLSERRMHDEQRDKQTANILRDYKKMIAQSQDIQMAPRYLRRAAEAGCELLYQRYNPSGSKLVPLWHDLRALLIYPKSFDSKRWWNQTVVFPLRKTLRPLKPMKQWAGCWVHERRQAEVALLPLLRKLSKASWIDLCNRHEKVEPGDDKNSRHIETEYTSYLTVARIFPRVGGRLAQASFSEHPFPDFKSASQLECTDPRITVVLPVGGSDRLTNFELVLFSFLNQSVKDLEVIVLEHSSQPLYAEYAEYGVRYEHSYMQECNEEFNKSLLLNRGVHLSRASTVLMHDADILVPRQYLEISLNQITAGYEAVRPLRFLFYADKHGTDQISMDRAIPKNICFEQVAQNSQGGSTMVKKQIYHEIGGHDESFTGWGGEDLEFLERLRTRKLFRGGFMPAVHLWHSPAAKKLSGNRNEEKLANSRKIPPSSRIQRLRYSEPTWKTIP